MNDKKLNGLIKEYAAIPRTSKRDLDRVDMSNAKTTVKRPFFKRKAVWGAIAALVVIVAIAVPVSLTLFAGGENAEKSGMVAEDASPGKTSSVGDGRDRATFPDGRQENVQKPSKDAESEERSYAYGADEVEYRASERKISALQEVSDVFSEDDWREIYLKGTNVLIGFYAKTSDLAGTSGVESVEVTICVNGAIEDERFVELPYEGSDGERYATVTTDGKTTYYAERYDKNTGANYRYVYVCQEGTTFGQAQAALTR